MQLPEFMPVGDSVIRVDYRNGKSINVNFKLGRNITFRETDSPNSPVFWLNLHIHHVIDKRNVSNSELDTIVLQDDNNGCL